eukprot:m.34576 g.34576  ORF g.34576 m.34576 type:complete len:258 (-) comp9934_c0_seq1:32-805(-)
MEVAFGGVEEEDDVLSLVEDLIDSLNAWDVRGGKETVTTTHDINFNVEGTNAETDENQFLMKWRTTKQRDDIVCAYEKEIEALRLKVCLLEEELEEEKEKRKRRKEEKRERKKEQREQKRKVKKEKRKKCDKDNIEETATATTATISGRDENTSKIITGDTTNTGMSLDGHSCNCPHCVVTFDVEDEKNNPFTRSGRKWSVRQLKDVVARFRVQLKAKDDALRKLSLTVQIISNENEKLRKDNAEQLSELYRLHREL